MRRVLIVAGSIAVVGAATLAWADGDWEGDEGPPTFRLDDRSIGGALPGIATPAFLAGGRLAVVGEGAVAIDADSGALIYTARDGTAISQLAIGTDAGVLAYDPVTGLAYVADRHGDRIVAAAIDEEITIKREWPAAAEPFGVALTPDHKTLLVSSIGDRALVAYDVMTGAEVWRVAVGREPRGVAISADGATALVTHLTTGTIERVSLAEHAVLPIALTTQSADHVARGAWAATFLGSALAVAPHQHDLPETANTSQDAEGRYGGGFSSPITHHLAFLAPGGELPRQAQAEVSVHQPRSLAWDGARDTLYVAGMGNDQLVGIERASQGDPIATVLLDIGTSDRRCGPDGIALADDGDVIVWCTFTRSVVRVDLMGKHGPRDIARFARGPTLVASSMDAERQAGMQLFYGQRFEVSNANLACGSCHLDGRADGLSWLIEKKRLQTPLLAGRIADTAPYKWTGTDGDLATSLKSTIARLDGGGLKKAQLDHLAAFVAGMPGVRPPPRDAPAIERGHALFASDALGCADCHTGPAYTDNGKHPFAGTLSQTDTPSLRGLAASAPYYHDGSAATLEALLRGRGAVHGMSDAATELTDAQVSDLVAFLESL